ncbi:MAG: DUF262 domain-containing protein [Prevotella sp.]|nr:DUF262 domain-containing protein [Prevotella sp.]
MARIDIKSDREFFREIYKKVEAGKYGIPSFQRDFVWTSSKIVDFFDSIWKGYPIGAVILWKPDSDLPTKDILTDERQDNTPPEYYVLDGRQRLTSFYGCVQNKRKRDRKFDLYFNLDTEQFSFKNKAGILGLKVADVYDTFELLMRLQEIIRHFGNDAEKTKKYIEKANKLNAVLQGYTVSEIFIEDCSLDEAEEVFARINSKGTDITKDYKLQALTYKRGNRLVTELISDIKQSLAVYHFETIKSDYIIACFYKFIGKNFYDAKVEDLAQFDLEKNFSSIAQCIQRSIEFLHNDCLVLSEKILPYKNQLIALTWYFFSHKEGIEQHDQNVLRKWFFYTTYNKLFNNGSLSNIRPIFNHFQNYIDGKAAEPLYYSVVEIDNRIDFRFRLSDVHTDFVILATINRRKKLEPDANLSYKGSVKLGSELVTHHIICLTESDRHQIEAVMMRGEYLDKEKLQLLALTPEMIAAYRNGQIKLFQELRQQYILEMERELLELNNIQLQ